MRALISPVPELGLSYLRQEIHMQNFHVPGLTLPGDEFRGVRSIR